MPDGASQVLGVRLFDRLPSHIFTGLTAEQKSAIAEAAGGTPWRRHSVDIRYTIRSPFGRYYVTLVAGKERRSEARLNVERGVNPLRTARNLTFIIAGALMFYGLALASVLVLSSIVEF
jgi:hypothetical protein